MRVATVALTLTGLSQQLARFQARSAFTGAGFTTTESEKVVKHPVRRRIIMLLMLLGNAGIVTAISSLMLSVMGESQSSSLWSRCSLLFAGLGMLWWVATSKWVDQKLSLLIGWGLRRFTNVDARDYAGLLHLTGDYVVAEMMVSDEDWLCDKQLKELGLNDEGVLVLGVEHLDGQYSGAPRGSSELSSGDTLLLYGRRAVIEQLDERERDSKGAWQRLQSVAKQKEIEAAEESQRERTHDIELMSVA